MISSDRFGDRALLTSSPRRAQITTAPFGTVKDTRRRHPGAHRRPDQRHARHAVVAGAHQQTGTYVFPNVTADTYTIEVRCRVQDRQTRRHIVTAATGSASSRYDRTGRISETRRRHAESPCVRRREPTLLRGQRDADRQLRWRAPFHLAGRLHAGFTPKRVMRSWRPTRQGWRRSGTTHEDGISAMDPPNNARC